ncbi:hypothetical protein P3W45_000824 [Vairimorpha bombi]
MIFCILILIARSEDKELEEFINTDVKIYFSGYPTTFLGRDNDEPNLIAHNKFIRFEKFKFNPKARIIKENKNYEIYFSGAKMCKVGNLVSKCSGAGGWEIDRKYFGYTLSKDGMCITKDIDDTVKMKKCVDTDDQIFSFKRVSDDCNPENKFSEEHSVHVNIIPDRVKNYTVQSIKKDSIKKDDTKLENIDIKDKPVNIHEDELFMDE